MIKTKKNNYFLKLSLFLLVAGFIFLNFALSVFSESDSVDVSLEVSSTCGNGTCDSLSENSSLCPADCGCNSNGVCETSREETNANCSFDCPVTATPSPFPGAIILPDTTAPVIFNILINRVTLNSAAVSWETDDQALCQVFLGKTREYEKEAISENAFYRKHSAEFIGLLSATVYHFKINCRDTNKNESETADNQFSTLSPPDFTPPANISSFLSVAGDKKIGLKWENPSDKDFKGVRILRSDKFYPADPWDGEVIYIDSGNSFIDTNLKNGKRYYYTAFAFDKAGNYSSGAVTSEVPHPEIPLITPGATSIPGVSPIPGMSPEPGISPFPSFSPPPEIILPTISPPPEIEILNLDDFEFTQEGGRIFLFDKKIISATSDLPLTASISYSKFPRVLKTIMVTLEKGNKFFSFLLRINREKTAYEATILTPSEPGVYPLTITVLDYKNQTMKKIYGELRVGGGEISFQIKPAWYKKPLNWQWLIYLILAVVFALGIIYFRKKIKEKKGKKREMG